MIRIDRYFSIQYKRLICMDGTSKQFDVSNLVKAFDDALAKHVLGIDDKHFWSGVAEKVTCHETEDEGVLVVLTTTRPRTAEQIRQKDSKGRPLALLAALNAEYAFDGLEVSDV